MPCPANLYFRSHKQFDIRNAKRHQPADGGQTGVFFLHIHTRELIREACNGEAAWPHFDTLLGHHRPTSPNGFRSDLGCRSADFMIGAAMPTLLMIEDSTDIHQLIRSQVVSQTTVTHSAYSAAEGIALFESARPDVVFLDVGLPDDSGLNVFRRIHEIDARVPVIFLTGGSTTETAIEAMSLGAYEYVLKPFEPLALSQVLTAAFEASRLAREAPRAVEDPAEGGAGDLLVGRSAAMHAVYKAIGRVSKQETTVLITGESGTGKELVARSVYFHSRRAQKAFLAINCAAIPETLLESELFGHEQGAFTGAAHRRIGKFEQCNGGTLFLDEIGDMTPVTQAKILRVLQDQQFERVGGTQMIRTDVRILAATNRNLPDFVKKGLFREDLYYRLNVYAILLPPLRERGDDLEILVPWMLKRFAATMDKKVTGIAPKAMQILRNHSWPGNVRELQSVLKFALVQATSSVIVPEFLPGTFLHAADATPRRAPAAVGEWSELIEKLLAEAPEGLYAEWLARTDAILLAHILRMTKGNLVQAAKILGIHRSTIRSKLRDLEISLEPFRQQGPDTSNSKDDSGED
jgi:DNA-binding NtrC family response regulator